MKRAYVLLLALLMLLPGCAGEGKTYRASARDLCCPYEVNHKKDAVEITLRDGGQSGIQWRVETIPEYICQVTQEETDREYTTRYRLSGKEEGVTQLTFTALQPDDTACFVLNLVVTVDSAGKAIVTSCQHQERKTHSVEAEGLQYQWNVDTNGILAFSFLNKEDIWSVSGDGENAFVLSNMMSTPAGCKFSAQAKGAGRTTVVLTGENTQRTVHVVIAADEQGKMEVISVQEQ